MSMMRRALRGLTRRYRAEARAICDSSTSTGLRLALVPVPVSATTGPPVILHVTPERAGRRELAELVPDHALGDEHRDVLAAVVHGHGVAEHVRDDRRATRPGLDDVLGALGVLGVHLLEQVVVDERALFHAAWHSLSPSFCSMTMVAVNGAGVMGLPILGRRALLMDLAPASGPVATAD